MKEKRKKFCLTMWSKNRLPWRKKERKRGKRKKENDYVTNIKSYSERRKKKERKKWFSLWIII